MRARVGDVVIRELRPKSDQQQRLERRLARSWEDGLSKEQLDALQDETRRLERARRR